jgi:two-component system sensor histidine kinase RegB
MHAAPSNLHPFAAPPAGAQGARGARIAADAEATGRRNLHLLVQLRWLAVLGQALTIFVAWRFFRIALPLAAMGMVLGALVFVNLVTPLVMRRHTVTNLALFLFLLIDVAALSVQLFLSGGITNPFMSLFLLQIVLGALLLEAWSSWLLVAITGLAFGILTTFYRSLPLPPWLAVQLSSAHIIATWLNFLLAAVLLVLFLTRINRNLRARDAHLAEMRQQAAEEDHIVRMGLLASGAAHELGTPLSSISVILADWKQMAPIAGDARMLGEISEMQAEVRRCKAIVRGILLASGEIVGDAPAYNSLRAFFADMVAQWQAIHPGILFFDDRLGEEQRIIVDRALAQVIGNVLDNALEAGASRIHMIAERAAETLLITVRDNGGGFTPEMLETLGRPYNSTKGKWGGGLGLFLAVNVLRKLGGTVEADNAPVGGAIVTLRIPVAALAVETGDE